MNDGRVVWTHTRLTLTAVFWGGTFLAGSVVSAQIKPFSAACLRFLIAGALLLGLVYRREGRLPRLARREAVYVVLLGLSGVFAYNAFFFSALETIEAGRAALVVASCPVFLALFSAVFLDERLTPLQILGVTLSVAGAGLVVARGDITAIASRGIGRGEALILGSVASWVVYSLVGRLVMARFSPLASVCWSVLIGLAALVPPALSEGIIGALPTFTWSAWACLFYLGAFGTVLGFVWYYEGIRRIGPVRAGLFINLVPVSAVILAWLLVGERLTASSLLGGALVIGGVFLTNRSGDRPRVLDDSRGRQ